MSKIALVKRPDLLRGNIIRILEKKIPTSTVTCYCEEDEQSLYEKVHFPDLIIIDLNTDIDIFKLIDFYVRQHVKVIVWSSITEGDQLTELFRLGLHGYLYNEMETSEFVYAINSVLEGGQYIHPRLSHILLNDYARLTGKEPSKPTGGLTEREWEVLELIVKGKKNRSIGDHLFISVDTVTNHVASILRKLNVPDRTNAALFAVKNGWFVL